MAKQITIKDSLYEKLSGLKGGGSFSNAIESLMNENTITPAETAKFETGAASQPKEVPACQ